MHIKYTLSGLIYMNSEDDCEKIVDVMLATDYDGEFCVAEGFQPEFTARLMEAGFLVMSMGIPKNDDTQDELFYVMLPKLHLVRSALFYENLHIKKSIRRFLNRYELRADAEFDHIIDSCVEKHGADWLTPPLVDCIKKIRNAALKRFNDDSQSAPELPAKPGLLAKPGFSPKPFAYPASFALYRDGKLVAGEFGVICGKIYTSYSGFYYEDNAGTVQLILAAQYLQEHGFSYFDMGMPMDYKNDLGAVDISPQEFVKLFRDAQV
ncbi:MAG: GNAT family N-acetyltransferase [Treponema sp.]|nr:GNAT family N-acetyltransferase [Treponema sp.]